jgi:hypothetical protein
MGRLLVPIDGEWNFAQCTKWLDGHPLVRELIATAVDELLLKKPANPVEYLRVYFEEMR